MKLGSILAKVGTSVLRNVVPGSGFIIDAVNEFLPKDKKLPAEATGTQITQAVNTLPPDQQAQLLSKEYDVEIAEINSWTQVQGSLAEVDKVGASTRPQIAMMMAKVTSFVIIAFSTIWMIAILNDQVAMIKTLTDSWPLMLTVIATPTALLRAYFGMRSKEKKNRYSAAVGQPIQSNLLTNIISMIRK